MRWLVEIHRIIWRVICLSRSHLLRDRLRGRGREALLLHQLGESGPHWLALLFGDEGIQLTRIQQRCDEGVLGKSVDNVREFLAEVVENLDNAPVPLALRVCDGTIRDNKPLQRHHVLDDERESRVFLS
jgi:hypothetical protein